MRIALGIEYDGSAYSGWQTQPDGGTVQDTLESALARFALRPMATVCAGRTDTGVHALDQVVHVDADVVRDETSWVRGVNRFLPANVAIRWARQVPDTFHARFGARRRRYDYWILNAPVRAPLLHGRAGWVFRPLDAGAMDRAAALLVGEHDFSAFRASDCQAASPVRTLHALSVMRSGALLRVRAEADAFLHHMVRNIVGALVWVGTGRQPAPWVAQVLATRDRGRAAPTFSAAGLYLARVQYDPELDFPPPRDAFAVETNGLPCE